MNIMGGRWEPFRPSKMKLHWIDYRFDFRIITLKMKLNFWNIYYNAGIYTLLVEAGNLD